MVAIGALLALVVATDGPAALGPSHERIVLRLAEKLTDDEEFSTQIDVGDEGPSVGAYVALADDPIFVPDLSKQVGTAESGEVIGEIARSIGVATNTVADYTALNLGPPYGAPQGSQRTLSNGYEETALNGG